VEGGVGMCVITVVHWVRDHLLHEAWPNALGVPSEGSPGFRVS
jgi:hypothetical protein